MRAAVTILASLLTATIAVTGLDPSAQSAPPEQRASKQVRDYSLAPLAAEPMLTDAEWRVELTRFNEWMEQNQSRLAQDEIAGTRIRLHLLLDAILKDRHAEGRIAFTAEDRMKLIPLFNWGTVLEMPGTGLVASYLNTSYAPVSQIEILPAVLPDPPLELTFRNPHYRLQSAGGGWTATLPYYFMLTEARHTPAGDGKATQVATVATLFGKHKKDGGYSRGEISLIFSSAEERDPFRDTWLAHFVLGPKHKMKEAPDRCDAAYAAFEKKKRLHREICFMEEGGGQLAVVYLGAEGPFQINRVHYLDFINSLVTGP